MTEGACKIKGIWLTATTIPVESCLWNQKKLTRSRAKLTKRLTEPLAKLTVNASKLTFVNLENNEILA